MGRGRLGKAIRTGRRGESSEGEGREREEEEGDTEDGGERREKK